CSTATQYFHLLRLQARDAAALPLVIMTPKSLLRLETSYGRLDEMAAGGFQPVIDDPSFAHQKAEVERLILCSGKVYYDLLGHDDYQSVKKTAILRIELLSPLPHDKIRSLIETYPNAKKLVWVQEEPKNMGARAHVRRRLLERKNDGLDIEYIGRPYRASPSEGYPGSHAVEQERIIKTALRE
ncbi:MAG: multifunctional oxoglutarate decarboxylase/oxoglutarate dehydrogenase thiamine pyrophosphate-binding subunit/dihydrolipoyllysine-residue succinyltransferase subunit, partial [Candidatus Eremiobacteraeota bacterium]|nr:multifunctional oxoglutarate decarboxylase/oxoglutarate dehydrogenase thiamine pyrophosphate-binding subunit/dihydrolipoyllysine-residue succinyltransferase subunit [Candidatus Eremiobacteraeota bacterium]